MLTRSRLPALARAEIDLAALAANYGELRRIVNPNARIMAVVKADAYGHGAVAVSRVALANGASWLAVARISEAVNLRSAGLEAPLLLLGHCLPEYVGYLAANEIRASVDSLASAERLSRETCRLGLSLKVHVKLDTGMGRLGVPADVLLAPVRPGEETARTVLAIERLPGLVIEGLYTHFANADSRDKHHARGQLEIFTRIVEELERLGLQVPLRHAANSAAVIEMPGSHLDMVRPGICQYGLWPSDQTDRSRITLRPVMTLLSTVIQVKAVPAGFKVSYGSTHATREPTRIATVAIGYADGYSRRLSSRGAMLVRGQRAPIVGRVCMDLTMIDVGHIPEVTEGDEVVVFGGRKGRGIPVDELATLLDTINYEVVSALTPRVERVYTGVGPATTQSCDNGERFHGS